MQESKYLDEGRERHHALASPPKRPTYLILIIVYSEYTTQADIPFSPQIHRGLTVYLGSSIGCIQVKRHFVSIEIINLNPLSKLFSGSCRYLNGMFLRVIYCASAAVFFLKLQLSSYGSSAKNLFVIKYASGVQNIFLLRMV